MTHEELAGTSTAPASLAIDDDLVTLGELPDACRKFAEWDQTGSGNVRFRKLLGLADVDHRDEPLLEGGGQLVDRDLWSAHRGTIFAGAPTRS